MSVVPMRPEHVDSVLAIECEAFPEPWTAPLVRAELTVHSGIALVALKGGEVAGYVFARRGALDEAEILRIAVGSDARQKGVGAALLRECLVALASSGGCKVTLEVRQSNLAARALYERAGFRATGIRKAYYGSPPEDAIVLCREAGGRAV